MNGTFLLATNAVWAVLSFCSTQATIGNDTLFSKQQPPFEELNVYQAWADIKIQGCDNFYWFHQTAIVPVINHKQRPE